MRRSSSLCLAIAALFIGGALLDATAIGQQKQAQAVQKKTATAQKKTAAQPAAKQPAERGAAASAALEAVPQGALAFGIIRNIGQLDAKVSAIAQDLQIPAPGPLALIGAKAGIQEGLDEKGAVIVAFFAPGEGRSDPFPLLLVPVTDYAKFAKQLEGGDAAIVQHGKFAAITDPKQEDRLKEVLAVKGSVQGLPADLNSWAAEHDAYFVAMPEGIKKALGPVREGLRQAKGAFPADNAQFKSVAAIFDLYDKMLATLENEVTHFGAGLRLDQGTIYLTSHSVFVPGGSLAQAAKEAQRPEQSALAALPAGTYLMAFDGVFPAAWFKSMSSFSAEMMRAMASQGGQPLSDDETRKLTEVMQKSMAGVKSMAVRVGTLEPGKSLYGNTSAAMKVDNSREFLTNYESSIREMMKAFEKSNNPFFKSYEFSKAEVGGVSTLQITMDMSAMFESVPDQNAQRMMRLMVGEDGKLTANLAAADSTTVVMAYSEDGLKQALETAKNKSESFTAQDDVAKTMKLLPKDAQWVGFLSPKGVVEFVKTIVQQLAPGGPGQLPPFPDTPPVGFGMRMTAQACDTSVVVPKEVLSAVSSYALMVRQLQPGVNGVPPQRQNLQNR